MAAITDFLKENIPNATKAAGTATKAAGTATKAVTAGIGANVLFIPGYAKQFQESENKLKAIVKIMADWFFWTLKILAPLRTFFLGGAAILGFNAIGKAIQNIVRETGSLQQALERLNTIRISEQQLAPFVGGLGVARARVAELLVLSARGPFRFEEIAQANRSLEVFTRGAFSSAEATKTIGLAAIATGNQIGTVAEAVGTFYQDLREGRPIESSAEQLRQLGIISQQSANDLMAMSKAGVTSTEVFNRLTSSIEQSTKGVKRVGDDLATVTAEHEKAAAELQKKFGAPWTENEIQNTKNMTVAMQAIAPAVGRVSATMASLFNGFSTVRTGIVALVSRIPFVTGALEGLVKGFGYLVAAAALVGTIATATLIPTFLMWGNTIAVRLLPTLFSLTGSMLTASRVAMILGTAFKVLTVAGTVGLVLAGAVAITGAIMGQIQLFRQAGREAEQMATGFRKSNQAIQEQIGAVKTLAEYHDALVTSMNQVVDAHSQVIAARQKDKEDLDKMLPIVKEFTILSRNFGNVIRHPTALFRAPETRGPRERAAIGAEREAERTATRAARVTTLGLAGPERERVIEQRAEQFEAERRQRLERELVSAGPTRRIQITREQAAQAGEAARQGRAGLEERQNVAQRTAEIEKGRVKAQADVQKAEASLVEERGKPVLQQDKKRKAELKTQIEQGGKEIQKADAKVLQERLHAQEGTSVKQFARAEQLRAAIEAGAAEEAGKKKEAARQKELSGGLVIKGPAKEAAVREIQTLEISGKILQNREEQVTANTEGQKMLQAQAAEEERILNITMSRVTAESQIASIKARALEQGKAAGDTAEEEYKIRQEQLDTEMKLEQARAGGADPTRMAELQAQKEQARTGEIERRRNVEISRQQSDMELQRRIAQREGRSQEAVALRNEEEFTRRMEQHRAEGMTQEEAKRRAMAETEETIRERVIPGGPAAVVSSLQRIGGGGGAYTPGGDPQLMTQKQIAMLIKMSNTYLKELTGKGEGVQ